MAIADLLKSSVVKVLIGIIAGVIIASAYLLYINPKDPPQGVLTCENSDVGIPISSGGGTIIDYEDLQNHGVFFDPTNTNTVFNDPAPDCYEMANTRFIIVDRNGNRSDGWQMGSILRVVNGTAVREFNFETNPIGIRRTNTQICIYQI